MLCRQHVKLKKYVRWKRQICRARHEGRRQGAMWLRMTTEGSGYLQHHVYRSNLTGCSCHGSNVTDWKLLRASNASRRYVLTVPMSRSSWSSSLSESGLWSQSRTRYSKGLDERDLIIKWRPERDSPRKKFLVVARDWSVDIARHWSKLCGGLVTRGLLPGACKLDGVADGPFYWPVVCSSFMTDNR